MTTARKTGLGMRGAAALGIALGATIAMALPALAQDNTAYLGSSLFGEYEVGHKGAGEDASGDFTAEIDLGTGKMCYFLEVDGLDEVTAAHIHSGEKGKNGDALVTLQLNEPNGDDICVDIDPELAKRLARNPTRFYVNVHTKAFPQGAVRGQLDE